MELFAEQNGECRAMERGGQHVLSVLNQAEVMVRCRHLQQMESILLKTIRLIAGEHYIHRNPVA